MNNEDRERLQVVIKLLNSKKNVKYAFATHGTHMVELRIFYDGKVWYSFGSDRSHAIKVALEQLQE